MTTPQVARFLAGFALVFLLYPFAGRPQQVAAINATQILDAKDGKIRVVPLATGLFHPWSLAFADSRTLLVTERDGRLRIIRDGVLQPEPAWTSPTPPGESADSLHFVAIHPKFAQNQFVYVSYPKRDGECVPLARARGRLGGANTTH